MELSKDLMSEEGGSFHLIVPNILDAGSIYGIAQNNGILDTILRYNRTE